MSLWANLGELSDALRGFKKAYIPLVLLLALMNYMTRLLKWEPYRRTLRIVLPFRLSLPVFLSGLVMSITQGKFGEVLKSYLLKQANGTAIRRSAPMVLAERFTDFIALVVRSSAWMFEGVHAVGVPAIDQERLEIAPMPSTFGPRQGNGDRRGEQTSYTELEVLGRHGA